MKAGKKSFIFLDIERFYLTRERVNIEDGPEEKKKTALGGSVSTIFV